MDDMRTSLKGTRYGYGTDPGDPATWDADMLFGCLCDSYPSYNHTFPAERGPDLGRWTGHDCGFRKWSELQPCGALITAYCLNQVHAPLAQTPTWNLVSSRWRASVSGSSNALASGSFEEQTVACTQSSGTFQLKFREEITAAIDVSATAAEVQAALEALPR